MGGNQDLVDMDHPLGKKEVEEEYIWNSMSKDRQSILMIWFNTMECICKTEKLLRETILNRVRND